MMSGGRAPKSVLLVCSDTLEEWDDLKAFLAAELPKASWVVDLRPDVEADWLPKSRMLPYAKIRLDQIEVVHDEFDAVSVPRLYVEWAQHRLRGELLWRAGLDTPEHKLHRTERLRSIAFKIRKYRLYDDLVETIEDRGQRSVLKNTQSQIEDFDLGHRRHLNPSVEDGSED